MTQLHVLPTWAVREYKNGMCDAAQINGHGLTEGTASFAAALAAARRLA